MDGRANPLMDRKVVGVVLFGVVAVVNSLTSAECSVAWCGVVWCGVVAAAVVVEAVAVV